MQRASGLPLDFDVEQLMNLLGQIYDTVADPSALTPALDSVSAIVRGSAAQLYAWDDQTGQIVESHVSSGLRNVDNDAYIRYYGAIDPRRVHVASMLPGTGNRCSSWFDERFVSGDEFYQDFFIPAGLRWVVGTRFDAGNSTSAVLAGLRPVGTPAYEDWTVGLMTRIAPHFQRAARLRARLERAGFRSLNVEGIISAMPSPAALFSSTGELLYQNDRARLLWAELPIRLVDTRLQMDSARDQALWAAGLRSASSDRVPSSLSLRGREQGVWRFQVVPCSVAVPTSGPADLGLVVVFAELAQTALEEKAAAFKVRYRLTDAEENILCLLLRGRSVAEISSQRGSSELTVRSQLHTMFDKTGFRSQRELIAAAMRP